jgi:hypothetical protein
MALVRERTIPTERPPLIGLSAKLVATSLVRGMLRGQCGETLRP